MKNVLIIIGVMFALALGLGMLSAVLITAIWNHIIAIIFVLPTVKWWQTFLVMFAVNLLLGGVKVSVKFK